MSTSMQKQNNTPKRVLITGASGFVGQQLVKRLSQQENIVLHVALRGEPQIPFSSEIAVFNNLHLGLNTQWQAALTECDVVIHTAARVHVMKDKALDPLAEFRKINVDGTLHLAKQAAQAGVKRFIFISTIKVNGEFTQAEQAFCADDLPNPSDAYAISKHEAEQGLLNLAEQTGMEMVIIRPPLIYGPGVKGNFLKMILILQKNIPLPLGAISNKRSLVSLENLVSLIITCMEHPRAANQIFLVSDGQDLSTTELLRKLGTFLEKPPRLLPIPQSWLALGATLCGQKGVFQRLCGSLCLDISKTCHQLDWQPNPDIDEALKLTINS